MASIPAHVLQVRDALGRLNFTGAPPPFSESARFAAIAWLQGDRPQPVDGYVFRLETERTPASLGAEPRWRYVLNFACFSLQAHDFEWKPLLQVEA